MLIYGTYDVVKEPNINGSKVEYECKSCNTIQKRKIIRTLDNANAGFTSAKCSCGRLSLFSDQHGNYYHMN